MGAPLYALIAAIKRSPIVVRLSERLLLTRDWASVRKSPDVDAYVLAWIANHVSGRRARRRTWAMLASERSPPTNQIGDTRESESSEGTGADPRFAQEGRPADVRSNDFGDIVAYPTTPSV